MINLANVTVDDIIETYEMAKKRLTPKVIPPWSMRVDRIQTQIRWQQLAMKEFYRYYNLSLISKDVRDKETHKFSQRIRELEQELEYRKIPDYLGFFRAHYNNKYEKTILLMWADWCFDNGMLEREAELRNAAENILKVL